MKTKIALVGNPNSGKTTLFNALTGANQYVGNWPGVTIEKKQGRVKRDKDSILTDLPGIYSLSCDSPEEQVTLRYLLEEKPDVVVNIVDVTNLERNLFLTLQVMDLGIPMVIALNMTDLVKNRGDVLDVKKLEKLIGCEIVEISALKKRGLGLLEEAVFRADKAPKVLSLDDEVEKLLAKCTEKLSDYGVSLNRYTQIQLLEGNALATMTALSAEQKKDIAEVLSKAESHYGDDSVAMMIEARYNAIEKIMKEVFQKREKEDVFSAKVDKILLNRFLAFPIFAAVMIGIYAISVSWLGAIVTDWTNETLFAGIIQPAVSQWLTSISAADWLIGLIVDGCIGGVGAVLGFVPQMLILFLLLSILEDCGYMARVAFMMDRLFRRFGLSGKSFIPMLIASGCGVPGIMACKTIENDNPRRMTVMTATFIPCGAKLPVIALIGGAMFPHLPWFAPAIYFMGIGAVLFSGVFLKKTGLFHGEESSFMMELPSYHIPAPRGVIYRSLERAKAFIVKAGTIIFVACGIVWFLSSFAVVDGALTMVKTNQSFLAAIGSAVAPIFAPLGFGQWESVVATVTGLLAKENVVGTFGVLLGQSQDSQGLLTAIAALFPYGAAALSFLVFNMLCAPCFAAIGAIYKEMGNVRWTVLAVGYQTTLAYLVAFCINQLGGWLSGGLAFGVGAVIALCLILGVVLFLAIPQGAFSLKRSGFMRKAERST